MTLTFNKPEGFRLLELGGGENRHPAADCMIDVRATSQTDFTADFNQPLPIKDNDFDGVLAQYVLEHISYRNVRAFIKEMHRIVKPGGKVIITIPNTEAQLKWIQEHPEGWDGRDAFDSCSGVLFGDLDYPENSHKAYFSPVIIMQLFQEAGFRLVYSKPYGARDTDLMVEATKDKVIPNVLGTNVGTIHEIPVISNESVKSTIPESIMLTPILSREEMYDKHYFNGGEKVGGYAREGYWDYPVHHVTAQHILSRRPSSVLELGCARGYVLKRIQDAGIYGCGFEISKHCHMTRVCDNIILKDICNGWQVANENSRLDLCYSIATLEHLPEENLPIIIRAMAASALRGLHGVDFGHRDDGFDKTHCTLKPKEWWVSKFAEHAPGWPVEIVDKEELERGAIAPEILNGDGKVKLNIGSFTTMHHYGWVNMDVLDVSQFAAANGYRFQHHDIRNGVPYATGSVDLIVTNHMLEHLTYEEGRRFLLECRRVLKPATGAMRILVPDAARLIAAYSRKEVNDANGIKGILDLGEFDHINDGCANAPTDASKLWSLLHEGHQACYDAETLERMLQSCEFVPFVASFRCPGFESTEYNPFWQIIKETVDMHPSLSLIMDAVPRTV